MRLLDSDLWQEIFDNIRRHKLRTALTAFGVFWGIFMLVNLVGVGNGLRNGAEANMSVKNGIYIWSGGPTSIPFRGFSKGRRMRMNDADITALYDTVPGIDVVAPGNGMGMQFTQRGSRNDSFNVDGIRPIELYTKGYELLEGRFLNAHDLEKFRKVAVIGERVREVLFGKQESAVGGFIEILGVKFMVVGVIKPQALNNWAQRDMSKVFLPHSTLRKAYNQGDVVHRLLITTKPGYDGLEVEQKIVATLQARHKIHPDDIRTVGRYNSKKDVQRVENLFSGIQIFSWFVAIGTVIAGAVGVGNIMLIAVKERTKEIGIRKALGATPIDIVATILQEALIITFVSGYMGLVGGVVSLEILSVFAGNARGGAGTFMNPQIDFTTALAALLVLLLAGLLAAWLPARKAAAVDPVIALQSE